MFYYTDEKVICKCLYQCTNVSIMQQKVLYYECKKMLHKLIFIWKVIEMCSRDLKVGVFW